MDTDNQLALMKPMLLIFYDMICCVSCYMLSFGGHNGGSQRASIMDEDCDVNDVDGNGTCTGCRGYLPQQPVRVTGPRDGSKAIEVSHGGLR